MRRKKADLGQSNGRPQRNIRFIRTSDTFEFLVREPWGASAISGYRKAARHFGLHTREDPTMEGSDAYRVLVHRSAASLRRAAEVMNRGYGSDIQDAIDDAEIWLLRSDVTWFAQDWRYWDEAQDEGALECLGWKRLPSSSSTQKWLVRSPRSIPTVHVAIPSVPFPVLRFLMAGLPSGPRARNVLAADFPTAPGRPAFSSHLACARR
jgi:hypothetical protein